MFENINVRQWVYPFIIICAYILFRFGNVDAYWAYTVVFFAALFGITSMIFDWKDITLSIRVCLCIIYSIILFIFSIIASLAAVVAVGGLALAVSWQHGSHKWRVLYDGKPRG